MTQPDFNKVIVLFSIVFLLFIIFLPIILYYTTSFEKDITVKEKYITQVYGRYNNRSLYYIVATDDTTYQIDNMWWKLDFNNMDDYAKLNAGKTYRVKGYGKRIPFLGMVYSIYDIGM